MAVVRDSHDEWVRLEPVHQVVRESANQESPETESSDLLTAHHPSFRECPEMVSGKPYFVEESQTPTSSLLLVVVRRS